MSSVTLLVLSVLVVAVLCNPEEAASEKAMRMKVPKMFTSEGDARIGGECTMEVTQKLVGECIKLGRYARGCASGDYLEAYHQDCI